jgi:hypothetical protein
VCHARKAFVLVFCGVAFVIAGVVNEAALGDLRRLTDMSYVRDRIQRGSFKWQRVLYGRIMLGTGIVCLLLAAALTI